MEINNNALIVGASRGIGLGFVKQLLLNPKIKQIYATYRHSSSASQLLSLQTKYPEKLTCLPLEITREQDIAWVIEKIKQDIGKLHLVINCVGILHEGNLQPEKGLRQIDFAQLTRYFQVNSIGSVLLAKHLPAVLKHSERSVFASISAKVGSIGDNYLGGWYGYRASKAALNMFMRTTAIEYRRKIPQAIVVSLHPGTTDTQLSQPFQKNVPPEKLFSVEQTACQLLKVIENLTSSDSGKFFNWDGTILPW